MTDNLVKIEETDDMISPALKSGAAGLGWLQIEGCDVPRHEEGFGTLYYLSRPVGLWGSDFDALGKVLSAKLNVTMNIDWTDATAFMNLRLGKTGSIGRFDEVANAVMTFINERAGLKETVTCSREPIGT